MRSASTVLLYDVILIITQEARKVKCCHGCGWAIKSKTLLAILRISIDLHPHSVKALFYCSRYGG